MKLVIKNLGSLQHAEIDLSKRFYLFTGYNNTGKTYVTKLLYQIFQQQTIADFSISEYNTLKLDEDTNILELEKTFVESYLSQFSKYLVDIVIPKMLNISKNSFLLKNISVKFIYNEDELRKDTKMSRYYLKQDAQELSPNKSVWTFLLVKNANSLTTNIEIRHLEAFDNEQEEQLLREKMRKELPKRFLIFSLMNILLQNEEKGFFLPANRGFLLENAQNMLEQEKKRSKEIENELSDLLALLETNGEMFPNKNLIQSLISKRQNLYTSDIDILLDKIDELRKENNDEIIKGTGYYDAYLQKMQDIMGGEIVMEKAHSLGYWTEKFKMQGADNEESINLYLASSSANQLALLFQFFKYWAKPERNFLMIDEPEINLHPENQIKVMNLLLSFVGEKHNRLLLTTHSPMIAEMVNNYLNLSFLKKQGIAISEELENMPYFDTKITLNEEEVGIYAFHGDIVEEYERKKYGVLYKNINKELNKLSNIRSLLTDEIYELENA